MVGEIDLPEPDENQVIVRQLASGICHTQLHQMQNPALTRPLLLGHESTGVVVGKGRSVGHVKEGDRVIVTWVPRHGTEGDAVTDAGTHQLRWQTGEVASITGLD